MLEQTAVQIYSLLPFCKSIVNEEWSRYEPCMDQRIYPSPSSPPLPSPSHPSHCPHSQPSNAAHFRDNSHCLTNRKEVLIILLEKHFLKMHCIDSFLLVYTSFERRSLITKVQIKITQLSANRLSFITSPSDSSTMLLLEVTMAITEATLLKKKIFITSPTHSLPDFISTLTKVK